MKIKKYLIAFSLIVGTLFFVAPKETAAEELDLDVKSAIAVDFDTGKIFYEKDSDEVLGLASITKLISIYVVLDAIKAGEITWEDTVTIPAYLYPLSLNWELSNVPLYEGNTYTVKDLYEASLISSANAAVIALSYHVSGSEEAFVAKMKEKLESIGITDATVVNASGLNNSYLGENYVPGTPADGENYLSAKDIAILARHLLTDYPEILETTKIPTATFGANTSLPYEMVNWNWMLPGLVNYKEGVDGLKTGTTDIAGACFVGTMEKDGHRMITVVQHANDHENNASARFIETNKLMDYVLNNWQLTTVDPTTFALPKKHLNVQYGKEASVDLTLSDSNPFSVWVKNGEMPEITAEINQHLLDNDALKAPVSKNLTVGKFTITDQDDLGYLESADGEKEITIKTAEKVEKANVFERFLQGAKNIGTKVVHFFQNLFFILPNY